MLLGAAVTLQALCLSVRWKVLLSTHCMQEPRTAESIPLDLLR